MPDIRVTIYSNDSGYCKKPVTFFVSYNWSSPFEYYILVQMASFQHFIIVPGLELGPLLLSSLPRIQTS